MTTRQEVNRKIELHIQVLEQHLDSSFDKINNFIDQVFILDYSISKITSTKSELQQPKFNQFQLIGQSEFLENIVYEMKSLMKLNQKNQQMINDFQKHDEEQKKQISNLKNQNEGQSLKLKEFEQKIIYKFIIETQCELILKQKQAELKISQNEDILKQLSQSLQFSYQLTFSTTYKHNRSSVTQDGKVIETNEQCCMCDQIIPKNRVIQFAVKVLELGFVMIGIGFRDIVQSQDFKSCYYLGAGTYNIHWSGYCYNHDQPDKNQKEITFKFSRNDIIIVEVDIQNKYVKWTKQSTNELFTLAIDTSKDLYPCVHLNARCKVEILNQW
ncbi:unnamed protein product [Paramecium sonneborni]|uniref:Uncharacterized protein n=1 Tax=Paramecium sonneborni TaxID=65129 RepID=A0A8S1RNI8_9CILI|nr:unnamed protein product [Paramecium sonneborni]